MRAQCSENNACRLCGAVRGLSSIRGMDERNYYFCESCYLIFVDKDQLPDENEEKERYLTHKNGIEFKGYVEFLMQAVDPALEFMEKGQIGLDYGCGPGPAISEILKEKGYICENFDPFFAGHKLDKKFNFIFSTEVFEHFFRPGKEISKISSLLEPGGILVAMTERWTSSEQFSRWYYTRDNSHVCFYHSRTFDHISEKFFFEKLFDDGKRVMILRKMN